MDGKRKGVSLSPPDAQSCPWLMFSHGKSNHIQTFYSIPDNRCLKRKLPPLSGNTIRANHDGWAVITGSSKDDDSLPCFLLHLISMEKILLPNLEDIKYEGCLLSSSPLRPDCVVAFFSTIGVEESRRSKIKIWRPTQENWVEVVTDQMLLSPFITCDGKIYGIYFSGYTYFALVDIHDNDIHVKRGIRLPLPTIQGPMRTNDFLIESCGEFFLVTKFMLGAVGKRTVAVQVYKLMEDKNTIKKDWIRVSDIGDRAFFVQKHINSFSCSATQVGLKGNSIYFTGYGRDTHMYRYSLLENRFYTVLPCPDIAHRIKQICWVMIQQPAGSV